MIEREMGNRGSKSAEGKSLTAVKEQRVDGSLCKGSMNNRLHIRCTLMGFERDYQIKILSKQTKPYDAMLTCHTTCLLMLLAKHKKVCKATHIII